jgi:hypothetical protein
MRAALLTRVALGVICAGVIANAVFNLGAILLGYKFPYSIFLPYPSDLFGDFFKLSFSYPGPPIHSTPHWMGFDKLFADYHRQIREAEGTVVNHFQLPPLPTLIALAVRAAMVWVDPVLLFVAAIGAALFAWFRTVEAQSDRFLGLAAMLSYPALVAVDRGHLFSLICACCLITASVRTFEDNRSPLVSMLLFAVALNFRPNAAIIPFAFWVVRKYRFIDMVQLGLLTIAIFLASLALVHFFYPAYTLATLRGGLSDYKQVYILGMLGQAYSSSLYGALRSIFPLSSVIYSIPLLVMELLVVLAIVAVRRNRMMAPAFTFVLVSAYALGSQVFADYHLMTFFIPILLLVRERELNRDAAMVFGASLFVLIPKNYLFLGDETFPLSIQVILNPLVLLLISAVLLLRAFSRPADQQFELAPEPIDCAQSGNVGSDLAAAETG